MAAGENELDFGHGGRCWRLLVATLLKASFLQLCLLTRAAPGETPDLGLSDQTMATHIAVLPIGGIILEHMLIGGGSEVERRVCSRIDDAGSRRCGATKSQRRTRAEVCVQGAGVVRRHGGVIDTIGEVYAVLKLEDGSAVQRW
jgi:hypothetical protein